MYPWKHKFLLRLSISIPLQMASQKQFFGELLFSVLTHLHYEYFTLTFMLTSIIELFCYDRHHVVVILHLRPLVSLLVTHEACGEHPRPTAACGPSAQVQLSGPRLPHSDCRLLNIMWKCNGAVGPAFLLLMFVCANVPCFRPLRNTDLISSKKFHGIKPATF